MVMYMMLEATSVFNLILIQEITKRMKKYNKKLLISSMIKQTKK
nr:MAG TPA: hypothetical protein [Caudoviricetes sp.]